ncbi:MAG: TMEM175 family protein, partial [Novosphingobium sp.]
GPFLEELVHLFPSFFAFILSFLVIGRFWVTHHALMDHVKTYDPHIEGSTMVLRKRSTAFCSSRERPMLAKGGSIRAGIGKFHPKSGFWAHLPRVNADNLRLRDFPLGKRQTRC